MWSFWNQKFTESIHSVLIKNTERYLYSVPIQRRLKSFPSLSITGKYKKTFSVLIPRQLCRPGSISVILLSILRQSSGLGIGNGSGPSLISTLPSLRVEPYFSPYPRRNVGVRLKEQFDATILRLNYFNSTLAPAVSSFL